MDVTHVRFVGTPPPPPRHGSGPTPARGPAVVGRRAPFATPALPSGLSAVVLAHAGLNPADYREGPLTRRTAACLRALRAHSESHGLERVLTSPSMVPAALNTYLIGFSGFFRDPEVFRTIDTVVMSRLRALARPVRVLSIGCSAGQELYSIAMLLDEHGLLDGARLVGLDCRRDALADAARGRYAQSLLESVDETRRCRFFTRSGDDWRVVDRLRARCEWLEQDGTQACPEGPWDLILCRNLFIYLQSTTADVMLSRMVDQLADAGAVVIGKAERPSAHLPLTLLGRCVYGKGRPQS
jgi:chemotaxis methyl-accepting protein methylase